MSEISVGDWVSVWSNNYTLMKVMQVLAHHVVLYGGSDSLYRYPLNEVVKATPKFNVGDVVSGIFGGMEIVGTVSSIGVDEYFSSKFSYIIVDEEGGKFDFAEYSLMKMELPVPNEISVGDTVLGPVGTVRAIADGYAYVENSKGKVRVFPVEVLKNA